jgi:hypothetical protein
MCEPPPPRQSAALREKLPSVEADAKHSERHSLIGEAVRAITMPLWWPLAIADAAIEIAANSTNDIYRGRNVRFGDGKPVIVVPGRFSGDVALAPLRLWLQAIGYRTVKPGVILNIDDRPVDSSLSTAVHDATLRIGRKAVIVAFDTGVRSALRVAAIQSAEVSDVIAFSVPPRLPPIPPGVRFHIIESSRRTGAMSEENTHRVRGSEMVLSINPEALRIVSGILRDISIELLSDPCAAAPANPKS